MARIRSIKPEFPHSESMGKVSREARLCFIMLWTIADDSGRLRGNSRMLASLLFPYDEDAGSLIDGWLDELEANECIVRYVVSKASYLQIHNWLNHQKIDKPTPSKLPEFVDGSRILANPRESSPLDRKGEEGKGEEGKGVDESPVGDPQPKKPKSRKTALPDGFGISDRVRQWAAVKGYTRLEERLEHFVSKARAGGYTYVDWDEAFMGAIRDDWAKLPAVKLQAVARRAL